MKITIPGRIIRNAVKSAAGIAPSGDDRPILRNVLIRASDEGVEVLATDTVVGLWLHLKPDATLQVSKPGKVAVNAAQLLRVLDTVANRSVTISCTPRTCSISAEGSRFRLCVEDASDFPRVVRFSQRKPFITVEAELIPKMMGRTSFCAHDEESFQLMHGILVTAVDQELRMVATNGQRLAITTAKFTSQSNPTEPFTGELVIPASQAQAIKKIVSNEVKTMDVQFMAGFLNFRTELGEVSVRALMGSFPPYTMGIPSNLEPLKMDRRDLIEILKQATALKSATSNFVSLTFDNNKLTFKSIAEGAGESEIEYDYAWPKPRLELTVNPDFMLQTLAAVRGDDIDFEIGSVMTPTILREKNPDADLQSYCVFAVVRQ